MRFSRWFRWLPQLDVRVWILFVGRLVSQTGTGFTLFYAAIFFVNQVGLTPTEVGVGLAAMSVSGVGGRIVGGSMADSPRWGRRPTLLWSTAISAAGALLFACANGFVSFVFANLIAGIGQGLFWPAGEAAIADITTRQQRNEAYALTRLADNLGLGIGVALSGLVMSSAAHRAGGSLNQVYRTLFVVDAVSFVVFFAVVYFAITETRKKSESAPGQRGWIVALQDRSLLVFAAINVLFTTYLAQISSSLPLYFNNFIEFPPEIISLLFTGHIALAAVVQLPVARRLNRLSRTDALSLSLLLWAAGFSLVWVSALLPSAELLLAVLALVLASFGMVTYNPSASALVADLAPAQLRGVYLSINSLCWAAGYAVGPFVGGVVLDRPQPWPNLLWLGLALSAVAGLLGLQELQRILPEAMNRGYSSTRP
ncbi:MFS transporter [Leptolyngbya sp. FACHB-261]|uniref:MDR family MFS transporter n=1 Tax=Leptolyngbya sp. FACHB-261 TaxID=2692806 RepID=UPI0016843A0E|nr:MFS transporter [Leptolyngbya sp. FACHB-261]MBD2103744.1 MFS transporter [Leptolyngbya sp. FACHB-261]